MPNDIPYSVLHIKNAVNTHTINTSFFVFYMSKFGIGIVGVFGISVAAELIWTKKVKLTSSCDNRRDVMLFL